MEVIKKLYIFTGKGGVGKTITSIAFCKKLEELNRKYLYIQLTNSKIDNSVEKTPHSLHEPLKLKFDKLELDLLSSSRDYIIKKLKSKMIGNWIVKTPFYESMINMIPGFNYVIYLGHILELLIADPELTIVLDSPSSGHAITMLESIKNFNEIFQGGVLYDDTKKMLDTLCIENFLRVNIITLPSLLALKEAQELKDELKKIYDYQIEIFCNNSLRSYHELDLPPFLKTKILNENKALEQSEVLVKSTLNYMSNTDQVEVIKGLVPSMQNLV